MKTVTFIQISYILLNFELIRHIVHSDTCESSIETRAVLISCPEKDTGCEDDDPLSKATTADEYRLLQVKPSEMKRIKAQLEREFPKRVTECKRKLVITMKLNNKGKIDCDDGFIVIDHVYDPITRGKARLLSPVIIKLRQDQMVQLYPLQFQKIVNNNPNEEVFTKEVCSDYQGCSVDLENPTCGVTTYNGDPIPFSEGFCCSCDPYINAMREILPDKHENTQLYTDPSLFGIQKNRATRSKDKQSMIINPSLLKMKAGHRHGARHITSADSDEDSKDYGYSNPDYEDERQLPNFFLERDRQIVNSPEDILKELCNLDRKDSDDCEDESKQECDEVQYKKFVFKSDNETTNEKADECGDYPEQEADCRDAKNKQCENNTKANNSNAATEQTRRQRLEKDEERNGEKDWYVYGDGPVKERYGKSHRKKRLIKDSEEHGLPYPNIRRSKRISNVPSRRMSEEFGVENDDKGEACAPNCTLPNYFFTHDKELMNPCLQKDNCSLSEYEDSSPSAVDETAKEPSEDQDENQQETEGYISGSKSADDPRSKMQLFLMKKNDAWDGQVMTEEEEPQSYDLSRQYLQNGMNKNMKHKFSNERNRHYPDIYFEESGFYRPNGKPEEYHGSRNEYNNAELLRKKDAYMKNQMDLREMLQFGDVNEGRTSYEANVDGTKSDGYHDKKPFWSQSYYQQMYSPSWDPRLFQKDDPKTREKLMNLLYNYEAQKDGGSKYSQNVYQKPQMSEINDGYYDEGTLKEERISRHGIARDEMYDPEWNDKFVTRDWNEEDNSRNRRRAGIVFKSHRDKRSVPEQTVKISKWEHRTPPGPEYQFDRSPLTKPKSCVRTSGGGDKLSLGDIQKNFAGLKPRSGPQGTEWEEAKKKRLKIDQERLRKSYLTSPRKNKRDVHGELKGKRHGNGVKRQERGGQDCTEQEMKTTKAATTTTSTCQPESSDPSKESTHCMKMSDLWYSVYKIKKPELAQLVGLQIYDKRTMCDGTTNWREVTKGYMIRLGTLLQRAEDEVPTISITYTPTGPDIGTEEPKIDTENYRLLIPSHLTNEKKASMYPQFTGGPSEFMLIRKEDITETGAECNKIGTSFEAFVRQPGRCSKPPGSCLKRQPIDYWREDMEARIRRKRGKYFIENFGSVSNTSIKSFTNKSGDFLAMDYFGEYQSILEIEMRADGNAIVRQGENAQIPSVYIDTTAARKTKIVLSVLNLGLTAALFRPRLGDCPKNLDPSWCPLEGPLVLIPPQQRHDFKLELSGVLPAKKVQCSVQVLNHYNKKVASRKIIIRKSDRCFCAFYCKCICIAYTRSYKCDELSVEEYNAAGYFDPIPQRSIPPGSGSEAFLANLKVVLISMIHTLLLLGIIKAVLGLFWRKLGIAGIPVIVGPTMLPRYYEKELACYQVVYDECGFPIHPQTCANVQNVSKWLEVFINIFFFYLYILRIFWLLFTSLPCFKKIEYEGCCRMDESSNEGMACRSSQNYSTNYFTYNVMAFTNKKLKQEESALCNPYKADEDPLEEDDTEFVLEEIRRYKKKNAN